MSVKELIYKSNVILDGGMGTLLQQRGLAPGELPELWNILKGDMSLIGPRPLLVKYLPLYNEFPRHRHDVKPGLTGWAQVNGRNTICWEQRFEYDVYYVNHISFWMDVKTLFPRALPPRWKSASPGSRILTPSTN